MCLANLISLLTLAAVAPQSPAAPAGPVVFTRQMLFAIPFQMERPDRISREPVEVRLYVSGDRGQRWDYYSKADPTRQRFLFRAGLDGEYWFQVRTVDRSGTMRPEGTPLPGLKVIVDTTPPKLQLNARYDPSGQVIAGFRIDEPYLRPETVTIQYRTGSTAPWQRVALGLKDIHSAGATHTGEIAWPMAGAGPVEVRLEAADRAGNPAVSQAQVTAAGRIAAGAPQDQRPANPVAPGRNWPPDNMPPEGRAEVAMSINGEKVNPEVTSVAVRPNPPVTNQYIAPPGPARMVNTRVFEVEYDRAIAGNGGRVELWGTRDGGQTWRNFGINQGQYTPFAVRIDEEGMYGFRLSTPGPGDMMGSPPKRGEQPEIWIGVDLTKPMARIFGAQLTGSREQGPLTISWEARDNQRLADRPVTLLFSQSPGGPWTPIASNLENTGRYNWLLDSRVPPRIYLRLEVRDAAGNVGLAETPQPVVLEQPATRITPHIRDVRPMGQFGP
jgi:hypothetical protein